MTAATDQLRAEYTARKAALEAERAAAFEKAQARSAELKRQWDDFNAASNGVLAAMTANIADVEAFLKALDALDAPPKPPEDMPAS